MWHLFTSGKFHYFRQHIKEIAKAIARSKTEEQFEASLAKFYNQATPRECKTMQDAVPQKKHWVGRHLHIKTHHVFNLTYEMIFIII